MNRLDQLLQEMEKLSVAPPSPAPSRLSSAPPTRSHYTQRIYHVAAKDGAQYVWGFVKSAESSDPNVEAFQYHLQRVGKARGNSYYPNGNNSYRRGNDDPYRAWIREFTPEFVNALGRDVSPLQDARLKLKLSMGKSHFQLRRFNPSRKIDWRALQSLAPTRDFASRWSNICDQNDPHVRALVRELESKITPDAVFKEVLTVHIDLQADGAQCRLKYHRVNGQWELLDRNSVAKVLATYDVLLEDAVAFRVRVSSKHAAKEEVFDEMVRHVAIDTPPSGGDLFDTRVSLTRTAPRGHCINAFALQRKVYVVHNGLRFLLSYLDSDRSELRLECRLARPDEERKAGDGDDGSSKRAELAQEAAEQDDAENAPVHRQCQALVRRALAAIGRSQDNASLQRVVTGQRDHQNSQKHSFAREADYAHQALYEERHLVRLPPPSPRSSLRFMQTKTALLSAMTALALAYVAIVLLGFGAPADPLATHRDTRPSSGGDAVPSVHDITTPLQKIAFGSCNDQSMAQPLWKNIAAHEPELWLWMGDNIYADMPEAHEPRPLPPAKFFKEATGDVLRQRYAKLLANPDYSAFVNTTPVIGIWDDHDFGINDAHKGYTHRAESQQIFLDFMHEPADSPRRKQEGIYTSYTVGAGDQTVKFILVDNRYNRDAYNTVDGDFLGPAQWEWLEKELMDSQAAFNVIVSGIQILPNDRFSLAEGWCRFSDQRERLLKLILASKAKGVILLSGDVHFSEINQVVCSNGENAITEITSSGMTHSWMQFHFPAIRFFPALLFTFANLLLPWEFRPTHDSLYGYINWGKISFDWDQKPFPVATVEVRGRDEQVKLQYEFESKPMFSETPAKDAVECKAPRAMEPWRRIFWQMAFAGTVGLCVLSMLTSVVIALWLVWFFVTTLIAFALRTVKRMAVKEKDE